MFAYLQNALFPECFLFPFNGHSISIPVITVDVHYVEGGCQVEGDSQCHPGHVECQ